MRVRLFELRLLAVALTLLWGFGGGIVLIAYRPGGPIDTLVGVAASLPLLLTVASIVWPPLVRGYRGLAGVFWLGLAAGLLLIPSIIGVVSQVIAGGTEPLLPSAEVIYPWALALLATSLFAGLGLTRQLYSETGLGRRRMVVSVAFAIASTGLIGSIFAGVSLGDAAVLRSRPAAHSRFGPTSADIVLPECDQTIVPATTAQVTLDMNGDVDGRSIGSFELTGSRSGSDVTWSATVSGGNAAGKYGAVRIGTSAWALNKTGAWQSAPPNSIDDALLDATLIADALSPGNRATAEDHGIEVVGGARARHCRVAVDGRTFGQSVPQIVWLTGKASLSAWRGQIDYWIFGDGEIGKVSGRVNGDAQGILPGLLATVNIDMTAIDRGLPVSIAPPTE